MVTRHGWTQPELDELRATYAALRRFAAVVAPHTLDPDDLVQEAFMRTLRQQRSGIRDLDAYLKRAVANLAANEHRRGARAARATARLGADGTTVDARPSDLADLERLPARTRGLLYLVEVEGRPIAEAARLTGCSEPVARMRLSRARRALRSQIEKELHHE